MEAPPTIGSNERRMHVRAYNHWVSLLRGRAYPAMTDLDPSAMPDFGPHGVVLDISEGADDPVIPFVGEALRGEGGNDRALRRVSDVAPGSLLSRLTSHIAEIIENHAPIGFEAEFVNQDGRNMMYRGILMPFSADQATIDSIYGVVNWKEAPDAAVSAALSSELAESLREMPAVASAGPVWADGPNAAPLSGMLDDGMDALDPFGIIDGPDTAASNKKTRARLRAIEPRAMLDRAAIDAIDDGEEFVLLVARRLPEGRLGIVAPVQDSRLLDFALARLAE